jgi:ATP-dependent protease HslVU (ClpYQ) peptidase subunit
MTCIVGIVDEGITYIGGERAASDGSSILSSTRPKVAVRNGWVYGYAGGYGIGQLLDYIFLPDHTDDIYKTLRLDVSTKYKEAIEAFSKMDDETTVLIGREGRLFELTPADWSVIEINETAIGSGGNFALGSLYTSKYLNDNSMSTSPEMRVALALHSAIEYSPMCQGPVDILTA